ncbi:GNAT family N-acetyltransferase [soil metagenome]
MSELFPVETKRLRFRRHEIEDAAFIHSMLSDPEHMRYFPRTHSLDEARGWINWQLNLYRDHGFGLWMLELKEADELVGQCGLTIQDVEGVDEIEIGYHISKLYWRQGLASEAACACRDYAFDVLELKRIVITTAQDNLPSQGVARKVGMSFAKDYIKVREGKEIPHRLFTLERTG